MARRIRIAVRTQFFLILKNYMDSDRAHASRQRRELIELKLTDAYHQAQGAESGHDLKKAGVPGR